MTFTPGFDDDRTDTYEAQINLQKDNQTAEEQFIESQQGLKDLNATLQSILGTAGQFTDTIDAIFGLSRSDFDKANEINKQISKYSSGPIVQTEQGPLYRAGDILSNVFQMDKDPEPLKRKTPTEAEKELRINKWVNDLAFTVDRVTRDGNIIPTHISKVQPKGSGYAFLGKAKAEWNQWAKRTGFIRELSDRKMTAYVEHLVGKDKYYDVFWNLPNEQRFRKGSRHGPDNVRILLDNRMKSFKDASETILKKHQFYQSFPMKMHHYFLALFQNDHRLKFFHILAY